METKERATMGMREVREFCSDRDEKATTVPSPPPTATERVHTHSKAGRVRKKVPDAPYRSPTPRELREQEEERQLLELAAEQERAHPGHHSHKHSHSHSSSSSSAATEAPPDGPFRCAAYCTAGQYNLSQITRQLKSEQLEPWSFEDVVHVKYMSPTLAYTIGQVPSPSKAVTPRVHAWKHVFFFKDGSFVCWGADVDEEQKWLRKIKPFEIKPNRDILSEEMFFYEGVYTGLKPDRIMLKNRDDHKVRTKEMLAFSYGLVRSLRLEFVEVLMETALHRIVDIPRNIEIGKLPSSKEWQKMVGEQMQIRGALNLHSELLETPDMYWEEPGLEHLFERMQQQLDVSHRISILNKRLDYTHDVTEVVRTYMTDNSSHKLEKIIIALIALEVLFYIADKSETFRDFTFESLLGIETAGKGHGHVHGHHGHHGPHGQATQPDNSPAQSDEPQ